MINKDLQKYLPTHCPACDTPLTFDSIHLCCPNNECVGKIARKLGAAAAMLDLKGIAGKTLEPFAEDFDTMFDLFTWIRKHGHDADLERYGIKSGSRSHEIFVNAFMNIKSLTYDQVILMFGFDKVGRKLSEQVAKDYCGIEPDYKGHEKVLVEMFKDEDLKSYIQSMIGHLESFGVIVDHPKPKANDNTIFVCMTGSPKNFGFKTKEEFISKFSNVNEVSISDPRCNYLITDDLNSTSGKMKAAEKKGIKIVSYGEFDNLI